MSNNNALTVTKVEGTAIEHYAEREIVRELVDRMMSFHPAAQEVGQAGMRMAAQMAILMNASPLPGTNEIHIWKDNKGIKVEPGVNYWRRRSREHGDVFWIVSPRAMNDDERNHYSINDGVLAAICKGVRKSELLEMMRMGFTKQEIFSGVSFTGIAIVSPKDYAKNSKPLIWTALKNAEKDFYRQAFPFTPNERYAVPAAGLELQNGRVFIDNHRLDFEAESPREYEEITDGKAEEYNDALFGMADVVNEPVVVSCSDDDAIEVEPEEEQIIVSDEPEQAEAEPEETKAHDKTPPNPEDVKMWREKVANQHKLKMITVAGMVANAVPYFDTDYHVMNYTEFDKDQVFMEPEVAVQEFDRLVAIGTKKANE